MLGHGNNPLDRSGEKIVIIGAGPSGLAAAHELTCQGHQPLVLEKSSHLGGLARTENYRGYLLDIGGHRFFTRIEDLQNLWEQTLGEDFLRVQRRSRIYYNGRFVRYPLTAADALWKLGPVESLRVLASYASAQIAPHPEEENLRQWVANRFGERLFRIFFQSYTEKVWGMPCENISADWAAQRIKGLSLAEAVKNAFFGRQNSKTLIDTFHYPGWGPA